MLYIVTGATGHLGNTLVKQLVAQGHDVRIFVLPKDNVSMFDSSPVTIFRGNVLDQESLRNLFNLENTSYNFEDVCLIHCAGIVSIGKKQNQLMYDVNVNGTQNVLDLVKELGIGHFIYISSVHALIENVGEEPTSETTHFDSKLVVGTYAKTKAEATKRVTAAYLAGYPITIIHPSGIIGPYDFGNAHMTIMLISYLNNKLNARIPGKYDFVDVRDVASAIITTSKRKAYGHYIISGHQIELKDLFRIMQTVSGRKTKAVVFPRFIVKMFIPLIERVAFKKGQTPIFTEYALYTLSSHSLFSRQKAGLDLDYSPRPIAQTVSDNALWLAENTKIKHKPTLRFILKKYRPLL